MAGKLKPVRVENLSNTGNFSKTRSHTPSSDPAKASTPANVRTTFGVPKKQK